MIEESYMIAAGCLEGTAILWVDVMNKACNQYGITSDECIAMFLAQTSVESNNFSELVESLNYNAQGLQKYFPYHFPTELSAQLYANQPERIANLVYAGHIGNGPESSGDGWKFRGRGLIQITGRANYVAFSLKQFGDVRLIQDPTPLEQIEMASMSAAWYWNTHSLNQYADAKMIETTTKIINGGLNDLSLRKAHWLSIRSSMGLT